MEKITLTLSNDMQGVGKTGDRVTLELQPSDVHDPTELPTYLAGFRPFGYRADEASPVVLVNNDEDKFRTFSEDDAFRRVDVKGSTSGAVPEVDPKSTLQNYKVVERFVGSFVPRQTELQTGNNYQPRMAAARRARRAIELDREIDTWNLLGTPGNFAVAQRLALGAGDNWNGGASSDPIGDLQTSIENSNQPVTGVWFNQRVANAFLKNPETRDYMRQMLGDSIPSVGGVDMTDAAITDFRIPGFPPFMVAAAKVKDETTLAVDYVMPDVAVLLHTPPGVPDDGEDISTSYTFRRRGPSGTGFEAREFFIENRGPLGGTMIVVSEADIAIMTGDSAGGIISGIIT